MKQTINLRDSHTRKLRDGISSELKGEVEIQVRNKKTGEIEKIEKHNMIVFGGREWLLRRAFGPMLSDNENNIHILNSAIKWIGLGNGGGEPGNPLQSGCTLGQDTDLYSPVRIRYPNDNNNTQLDGYYASRILSDGSIVPGYYKQISYVSLKEDMANPYEENGIIHYPKTIAEIRIELSSDDCNGANYTNLQNNVAYQDINEAALFIADETLTDPGTQQQISNINIYPSGANNRINYNKDVQIIQPIVFEDDELYWGSGERETSYYPAQLSQYFDVYEKIYVSGENQTSEYYDVEPDGLRKYFTLGRKLSTVPIFIGTKTGSDHCCVRATITSEINSGENYDNTATIKIVSLADDTKSEEDEDSIVEIFSYGYNSDKPLTSLKDNIAIISHGTVYVRYDNRISLEDERGERYPVFDTVQYRNTYNQGWTNLIKPKSFVTFNEDTKEYEANTKSDGRQWLPIGYKFDDEYNLIEITPNDPTSIVFDLSSTIRVNETTNTVTKIKITGMEPEESSYQVRCYVSDADIKLVREGMRVYTVNDPMNVGNTISPDAPLMVTGIYDRTDNTQVIANMRTSYFTVDRPGTVKMEYPEGFDCYVYDDMDVQAYRMFSRCTFSSIRKTSDREVVVLWRVYF